MTTIFMYRYLIKVIKQHEQRVLEYHTKSEKKKIPSYMFLTEGGVKL